MRQSEEQKRLTALRKRLDTVIGGRYIEVVEKAEGMAIITSDRINQEDVNNIVAVINQNVKEGNGGKELAAATWRCKPINYQAHRTTIENAPLTRRRYVDERTPLMEVRILHA